MRIKSILANIWLSWVVTFAANYLKIEFCHLIEISSPFAGIVGLCPNWSNFYFLLFPKIGGKERRRIHLKVYSNIFLQFYTQFPTFNERLKTTSQILSPQPYTRSQITNTYHNSIISIKALLILVGALVICKPLFFHLNEPRNHAVIRP